MTNNKFKGEYLSHTSDLNTLRNDNVYVKSNVVNLTELTGMPSRKGLERAIISEGTIVNVVSDTYGHLPNEDFFAEMERALINADLNYATRSINRDNRSFRVDHILNDERYVVKVKGDGKDILRPMITGINSYDGSNKTTGYLGFFRKVCSNGLHVAQTKVGFAIYHRGDVARVVMPEIRQLVKTFMDNEFYQLSRKFEVMAETPITNLEGWVKLTADHFKLFTFEKSEKNPAPSLNAQIVIDTVRKEANQLGTQPNVWLGYNAINALLNGKLKKTFTQQAELDNKIFAEILTVPTN